MTINESSLSLLVLKMKTEKVPCKQCAGVTNHAVLHEQTDEAGFEGDWFTSTYQIVRCLGCDSISFRQEEINSNDRDEEGRPEVQASVFPPRLTKRKQLESYWLLPERVRRVYMEVYRALEVKANILAGIGIRAVIESVCHDNKANGKDLEKKIDDLVEKRLLTPKQAEFLHGARFLGNKAAHESQPPEEDELDFAMDIMDNLLMNTYILPKKQKALEG